MKTWRYSYFYRTKQLFQVMRPTDARHINGAISTLSLKSESSRFLTYVNATFIPSNNIGDTTVGLRTSTQFPNGTSKAAIDYPANSIQNTVVFTTTSSSKQQLILTSFKQDTNARALH
jgi:hypothetical protein